MKKKPDYLIPLALLGPAGCVSVKEYQKSRLNDADMKLSARKSEKFEQNFYLYREGAAGGKSGCGCGCN